jgi:hypothetical protein
MNLFPSSSNPESQLCLDALEVADPPRISPDRDISSPRLPADPPQADLLDLPPADLFLDSVALLLGRDDFPFGGLFFKETSFFVLSTGIAVDATCIWFLLLPQPIVCVLAVID